MLDLLKARLRQGYRTTDFPHASGRLPERFRGRPVLDPARCPEGCHACADACPTGAIAVDRRLTPRPGRVPLLPGLRGGLPHRRHRLHAGVSGCASTPREGLVLGTTAAVPSWQAPQGAMKRLFGRSLKLRQVSRRRVQRLRGRPDGLGNVGFDLGRFGIQFVASPRHADGIVVTGPVTRNMADALRDTYEAVPTPKLVIAVGRLRAVRRPLRRRRRRARTACPTTSPWTSTSPAVRPIRSPSSMVCCASWAASRTGGCMADRLARFEPTEE